MIKPELKIFEDLLIIEALFKPNNLVKQADSGFVSGIIDSVSKYVSDHIDPNNKVTSVLNLFGPEILAAIGLPGVGLFLGAIQAFFDIDLSSIFSSIKSGISGLISGGKQTDSASVEKVIESAIDSSSGKEVGASISLRDAQLFKIALDNFAINYPDFETAKPKSQIKLAAWYSGLLGKTAKAGLFKTIKWVVIAALAHAGFIVAGDAIHNLLGKSKSPAKQIPEELKLQVNPSYSPENYNTPISSWTLPGNINSISDILISWTKEIYPQLKNYDALIKSTDKFQEIVAEIKAENAKNTLNFISMPKDFHSRKQVVDNFVTEIQNKLVEIDNSKK